MLNFLKNILGGGNNDALQTALNNGAFLVDVRTPGEFAGGSVKGAVNIPLNTVSANINKFKNKKAVVVFCASGMRSSQAKNILVNSGISNVYNGGPWHKVQRLVQ